MRDKNKNSFRQNIREIDEAVLDAIKLMSKVDDKERLDSLKLGLLSDLIEKTISHYSVGDSKEIVSQALSQTIVAFVQGFKFDDGYGDMDTLIWLVSLAILCDIDIENFKKITSIIQRDSVNDKLLNFLIKSKDPDWLANSNNYIQEHPYKSIDSLLNETNDNVAVQKIKAYLDVVWYKGHDESYWHDSHKDSLNLYFGYWAWEVAAVVKILGFNDEELQDQKYYPYDAVHW
ncbi:PoNe immunity protein domain-containing protein [Hanstruepera neustonica]|nr:PoNe immunity protein domain-containing protein [Hanstruepera neustonica]